jgi:hypothetical protein
MTELTAQTLPALRDHVPTPGYDRSANLSFVDGALVSCGFGTAYAGLLRLGVSGGDVS